MKKNIIVIICITFLFILSGCKSSNNNISIKEQHISLIDSYLDNLKNGNIKTASENIMFTEAEINAHVPEIFCTSMEGYDYKEYTIKNIQKLNNSIYLANIIVKTNFDSQDKSKYIDTEFNPFIILYNNEYKLALIKEQVPKSLYGTLKTLPDNYNDNLDYLVIEDSNITFN